MLLSLLLLPLSMLACACASAEVPPDLRELGKRMQTQGMQCVPFTQTKHLPQLDQTLAITGEISVFGDVVDWRTITPIHSEYQFRAEGAWRRNANGKWQRLQLPPAAMSAFHSMLSAMLQLDFATLEQQFRLETRRGPPLELIATPRRAEMRAVIRQITLKASESIDELRIDEANGSYSEYRFSSKKNGSDDNFHNNVNKTSNAATCRAPDRPDEH